MNNQAEKFHQENDKMLKQLEESLESVINKFNRGIIPGEPDKSDLIYMLDTYLDLLIKFKETKTAAFTRLYEKDNSTYDETSSINELSRTKEGIEIIIKIGYEKMLLAKNKLFETAGGRLLVDKGYCEEVLAGKEEKRFYILSAKGEKILKSKEFLAAAQKSVCSAIVPAKIINESFKWSNLYVRRVEMINEYYRFKKNDADHIIFSLDESKEMVFGCDITDFNDITYVFAGIFDEKIDDHIELLKEYASSGKIDHIVIINYTDEGRLLLEGEGLVSTDFPKIEYQLL